MKKVNVVMGGPSAEHEISLRSGREVLLHLDRGRYQPRAVVVSRDRQFYYCDVTGDPPALEQLTAPASAPGFKGPFHPATSLEVWAGGDVAFLALHGSFGEDGLIQGFLETIGMPYTGSGVFASAVAMNKIATKEIFERNGIRTPPYSVYGRHHPEVTAETIAKQHGFPCFVKCPQSGSSRLMGRAGDAAALASLLAEFGDAADEILIETAIAGDEFSCAVLEQLDGTVAPLPPIEIRPKKKGAFFDFEAKYSDGASEEIVPAPRPAELLRRIEAIALKAHLVLGCRGISRTDMILKDGEFFALEINTLPGLTSNSLAPRAFTSLGRTYGELLDLIIQTACVKKR